MRQVARPWALAVFAATLAAGRPTRAEPGTTSALHGVVYAAEGLAASGHVRAAAARVAAQPAAPDAVVRAWDGGRITWGFYRAWYDAQVLLLDQAPAQAYRALIAALAGLPAYTQGCHERLAWCVTMARCCAALQRCQDARRYIAYVQRHAPSNSVWQCHAIRMLAWIEHAEGRARAARERFRVADRAGVLASDDLVRYATCEFACGRPEDSAALLWRAAASRDNYAIPAARDPLFRAVRQHWHQLTSCDQLDWFSFLERALVSNALAYFSPDWISYCVHTRLLLHRVYPELLLLNENDAAAVRAMASFRGTICAPYVVPPQTYRHVDGVCDAEDTVNQWLERIDVDGEKADAAPAHAPPSGGAFSTDMLARVAINDSTARFALPWVQGVERFEHGDYSAAAHHLHTALAVPEGMASPLWYARAAVYYGMLLEMMGRNADELYQEALRSAPQGSCMAALAEARLLQQHVRCGDMAAARRAAEEIIARYAGAAPAQVFFVLAQTAYAQGEYRAGCAALCEAFARSIPAQPHAASAYLRAWCANKSLHTCAELERMRALLRAVAAAHLPSPPHMPSAMSFLARANEAWWDDELALARQEEAGVWNDDAWDAAGAIIARRRSLRAARVHLAAQVQRDGSATNTLDWCAWERACAGVAGEDIQTSWPDWPPAGGSAVLLDNLAELLQRYRSRMPHDDYNARTNMISVQRARLARGRQ